MIVHHHHHEQVDPGQNHVHVHLPDDLGPTLAHLPDEFDPTRVLPHHHLDALDLFPAHRRLAVDHLLTLVRHHLLDVDGILPPSPARLVHLGIRDLGVLVGVRGV